MHEVALPVRVGRVGVAQHWQGPVRPPTGLPAYRLATRRQLLIHPQQQVFQRQAGHVGRRMAALESQVGVQQPAVQLARSFAPQLLELSLGRLHRLPLPFEETGLFHRVGQLHRPAESFRPLKDPCGGREPAQ